ncbi:MAG: hypothetical protein HY959_10855 [Ignavibacteriae bacterium]|nr:hypothetical protein [Ignavibacteriota bacterium]
MLNNIELNRRIRKLLRELYDNWRIASSRIAVDSGVPSASLSYMIRGKFEWKLNHLLSIMDFLTRHGVKVSLPDLFDFNRKIPFKKIFDMKNADFSDVITRNSRRKKNRLTPKKKITEKKKDINLKKEIETILFDIGEVVKENRLYKKNKILIQMKMEGKNYTFQKEIKF